MATRSSDHLGDAVVGAVVYREAERGSQAEGLAVVLPGLCYVPAERRPGVLIAFESAQLDERAFACAREHSRCVEAISSPELNFADASPFRDPLSDALAAVRQGDEAEWQAWALSRRDSPDWQVEWAWVARDRAEQMTLVAALESSALEAGCRAIGGILEKHRNRRALLEMVEQGGGRQGRFAAELRGVLALPERHPGPRGRLSPLAA